MNKHRQNPFINALRGIFETFRSERNFKIHLGCAALAIALGIWTRLSASDWRWIALCITVVFVLELLNTALEAVVDLLSPNYHPLAKKAKDAAAGAVLVGAIFALIVGASVFLPKLRVYFFE
ncbi:diacylglycerol kinase family protein [Parapedobacter indicus]|uniref:Undecaprenol kinase/diacylglycerol kinase (ATP) n=1 Tax=Parapedobacter indicus TaxID=1477437 RepID=A0A1I3K8N7_9SPHI|nr:diacylglycerol kinase family protein [Parapedobacter indicus]PPL01745.1 undecaprenol kinase [Parapedobacter indicus]SFI68827.1 undecaprenol kinase/diacylglycerol kinase (ATP) [Parapedobacter indicus]